MWNEPELMQVYWIGTKEEYFQFYKETALAVKSLSQKLKVGGPSITHQALKDGLWLDDEIQILAYNFAYFDDLFLKGDTSALTYKDRYKVFESKGNIEQQIELRGLSGQYKITKYQLNRNNGSAFDEWLKLGSPENMTIEEIEYLKMKSHPKLTTQYIDPEDTYTLNISLPVHGLELVIIDKVY